MFRCENCGSGYSAQAAGSWACCPRCMAKERVQVPLTFEIGWQRPSEDRAPPVRSESDAPRRPALR